ncbi:MAG: TolC family protein [Rikenellaceae bacterium]|nr:TolC family protein [Rikenellaceae bacterium]
MKRNLTLLAALVLCSTASAQTYTLEQCRTMALENNNKMKNSRLDVDIAGQTRREAFTNFFPNISAAGMAFDASHDMLRLSVPLELPIPGLTLPPLSMGMMKHGLMGGVTALQPLFAGRQVAAGNRLARIGEEAGGLKLKVSEREVNETVEKYFWQIVALRGKLETLDAVDRQLEQIRRDVEMAVKAGISTRNDLLRVELKQQETESSRLKVENGINVTRLLLAQYVGMPLEEPFDIETEAFGTPDAPESWYTDAAAAAKLRPEARLLDKNVEASKQQIRMTRGRNMPTVGVGAGYLYHDLSGQDNDFGMVFASVSVPITGWWGGSHAVRREQLKRRQAENDRRQAVEMMQVEITQCWNELQEAYKQILLARKTITSATENLRLNEDYFRAGTVSLTDLLDAQTLLQQGRDLLTDASADYRVKLAKYLLVTGR